jgi:TPR repeat protein
LLRPLAEHGDPEAQYDVGFMYYSGRGAAQNFAEALKWYRLAAARKLPEPQHDLDVMYLNG